MIAAVRPTSASSRSGTPAPRSDRASVTELSASLTTGRTVLDQAETTKLSIGWGLARTAQCVGPFPYGAARRCSSCAASRRVFSSLGVRGQAVSVSASMPSTSAMAAAVTGPSRSTRGWLPVRSTIVDAACCADGPPLEVHLDQVAELLARVGGGDGGRPDRRCWRSTPPSDRLRAAARSRRGAAACAA